jgi:hypothetical protein
MYHDRLGLDWLLIDGIIALKFTGNKWVGYISKVIDIRYPFVIYSTVAYPPSEKKG